MVLGVSIQAASEGALVILVISWIVLSAVTADKRMRCRMMFSRRKSVKRTAEKIRGFWPVTFSRPLRGLNTFHFFFPAVNCWAIIMRPLCGLINLLFGQGQFNLQVAEYKS